MKTLTKEDKKYIQQIIWGATNPNRNQGYWDMLHEIKDAETSLNKTQRQINSLRDPFHERSFSFCPEAAGGLIILQSRSPSCGVNEIYDGTFTGKKVPGHGIFAGMALDADYRVIDVGDLHLSGLK